VIKVNKSGLRIKRAIVIAFLILFSLTFSISAAELTAENKTISDYKKMIKNINYPELLEKELDLMEQIEFVSHQPFIYRELGAIRLKIAVYNYSSFKTDNSKSKKLFKALEYAASAVNLIPESDQSWLIWGMILSEFKNERNMLVEAGEAFIKAAEINPANAQAQIMLAYNLMEQGRFWSAIEQYKNLFNKDRSMLTGTNIANLSLAYIADGRVEAGIHYLIELSKKDPENFYLNTSLAVLYQHSNHKEYAELIIESLLEDKSQLTADQQAYLQNLLYKWNGAEKS